MASPAKKPAPVTAKASAKKQRSIDGVAPSKTTRSKTKLATPRPAKKAIPTEPIKTRPTMQDVVRSNTDTTMSRTVQHSKTLMRSAVSKPAKQAHHKAVAPLGVRTLEPVIKPKASVIHIDEKRLKHAEAITKSAAISRFGSMQTSFEHTAPAPVASKPAQSVAPIIKKHDMFLDAVNTATSHTQPLHKVKAQRRRLRRGGKILAISSAALAVALLFGFVVFQNMGNIRLQLASSKAGFAATVPSRKPSGFSLINFSANTGVVQAHFSSNSDSSRTFTITEKPSAWDSATLRDSFVKQTTPNYQVVQSGGRTIYLYNNDSATWVNNGTWYLVTGANTLSNAQLIQLATSM